MTEPATDSLRADRPDAVGPERYDLLVIGGGPAGLAAAAEVGGLGLAVGLVDERPTFGGQIYKQLGLEVRDNAGRRLGPTAPPPADRLRRLRRLRPPPAPLGREHLAGRRLIDAARASGARLMPSTTAVAIRGDEVVLVEEGAHARTVRARRILLAPGAHDRPVAFPGWTLPGVLTAGGAQTLVKTQRVLPGRRLVFAGSGPLALAFPAQLHGYGANVGLVLEAGPRPGPADVLRLAAAAPGNATLLRDAVRYRAALLRARIPLRYRRIVIRAEGEGRVEAVVHAAVDADWRVVPGTEEWVAADTLCVGYGFFPSTELLALAGCERRYDEDRGGPVAVADAWQRTTVPGVSAAGDGTGVAGSIVAIAQGRLAALGAALDLGALPPAQATARARPLRRALARKRAFAGALARMHKVGPGIYELATEDTVICRCEEVTRARLDAAIEASGDVGVVKGLTRAGMGLCQGRNCQRQVAASIARRHGWNIGDVAPATPRAPVRPVPLGAIADESVESHGFFTDAAV